MNNNQHEHLDEILDWLVPALSNKYVKGAKEHKSQLNKDYSASQLIDMALEEAIDQVVYLYTLRRKI